MDIIDYCVLLLFILQANNSPHYILLLPFTLYAGLNFVYTSKMMAKVRPRIFIINVKRHAFHNQGVRFALFRHQFKSLFFAVFTSFLLPPFEATVLDDGRSVLCFGVTFLLGLLLDKDVSIGEDLAAFPLAVVFGGELAAFPIALVDV